jgi:aminoglycoside phosphotransferase family enzyme/predicted kinase
MTPSSEKSNGDSASNQAAVLDFLGSRHNGVKRIDTHASIVFLEPDRVLKIKRAVRLPFLDYSTLAKRRRACDDELAINKRHAPNLYRRVVPITQDSGKIEIGGRGTPVEWAVEMARFDEQQTFDHLSVAEGIAPELADELADVLLASHRIAEASDGSTWLASIADIIDRNTQKFRSQKTLASDTVERLHALSHQQREEHGGLLRERAAGGLVRRCHGDAHLGNIVLIEAKPVLFDAIEFDPVIATVDVLYDIAFTMMDLVHFDQRVAANRLFNRYLQQAWSHNGHALRLLPLFQSMRAAVRSQVLFTKHEQSADDDSSAKAKAYFDLALRLIAPSAPAFVAVGGRSGTGKTVLARSLAGSIEPSPGAVLLRSDVVRKELFGVGEYTPLPPAAYLADESKRVYQIMISRAREIVDQGFSVVLDAAFLRERERDAASRAAHELGVRFRPLFLIADPAIRLSRVTARKRDASDATLDVATRQENIDIGKLAWPTVDASGSSEQTLRLATECLGHSSSSESET